MIVLVDRSSKRMLSVVKLMNVDRIAHMRELFR